MLVSGPAFLVLCALRCPHIERQKNASRKGGAIILYCTDDVYPAKQDTKKFYNFSIKNIYIIDIYIMVVLVMLMLVLPYST